MEGDVITYSFQPGLVKSLGSKKFSCSVIFPSSFTLNLSMTRRVQDGFNTSQWNSTVTAVLLSLTKLSINSTFPSRVGSGAHHIVRRLSFPFRGLAEPPGISAHEAQHSHRMVWHQNFSLQALLLYNLLLFHASFLLYLKLCT
jgi:hypothetical protein